MPPYPGLVEQRNGKGSIELVPAGQTKHIKPSGPISAAGVEGLTRDIVVFITWPTSCIIARLPVFNKDQSDIDSVCETKMDELKSLYESCVETKGKGSCYYFTSESEQTGAWILVNNAISNLSFRSTQSFYYPMKNSLQGANTAFVQFKNGRAEKVYLEDVKLTD